MYWDMKQPITVLLQIVPSVRKQLVDKSKHLQILEKDAAVTRAEIMRLNQLLEITKDETTFLEACLLWGIRDLMGKLNVRDVGDLTWTHTEMILRRVFIMMNMQKEVVGACSEQ